MKLQSMMTALAISVATLAMTGNAQARNLFFEGDMVRGHTQDGATGPTCVLTSQYKRREEVVWRIRVLDPDSNMVNKDGLTSLVVELSDGQKFDMHYGKHPRGKATDEFWATSWVIPADFPTGTIEYKVIATDTDGTTHEWTPFNVGLSKLMVIPGDVTFTK